jgi:hypothetical protein
MYSALVGVELFPFEGQPEIPDRELVHRTGEGTKVLFFSGVSPRM